MYILYITFTNKVDSVENAVREAAMKLLVSLIIVDDDSLSDTAATKIMATLLDSARTRGYRNRWKSVVSHISVNEYDQKGSFEYDNYGLVLINFIINSLQTVEERTDERRLLNSLKFSDSLTKLTKSVEETLLKLSNDDQPSSPQPTEEITRTTTPINSETGLISYIFITKKHYFKSYHDHIIISP